MSNPTDDPRLTALAGAVDDALAALVRSLTERLGPLALARDARPTPAYPYTCCLSLARAGRARDDDPEVCVSVDVIQTAAGARLQADVAAWDGVVWAEYGPEVIGDLAETEALAPAVAAFIRACDTTILQRLSDDQASA